MPHFKTNLIKSEVIFDLDHKRSELNRIEQALLEPGIWEDQNRSKSLLQEQEQLKTLLKTWEQLETEAEELAFFLELASQEDPAASNDLSSSLNAFASDLKKLEIATLLNQEFDNHNAIFSLHAGAGGIDAQDWTQMLLRMYSRWAENKGFALELVDSSPGEEAGIKSATAIISGTNAYGLLKGERGIHRLVRLSPFDAAHRRHTSFAQVEVLPEIGEEVNIKINPEDLRIDTFRSSGAGGQHVNKTDSAVRITHIPTGIIISCQNERSQHSNRLTAMKILRARLFQVQQEENRKRLEALKGEHKEIAWGNQIRSYVLQPYTLIKDHRTNYEEGNVQAVLDGALDGFIYRYLETRL